jgi:general secretion pathway protein K
MSRGAAKQAGAAMIVALLAMGFVASMAALMAADHQLAVRRVQNHVAVEQSHQYLLAAEELAALILRRDSQPGESEEPGNGGERDHLGERWAQEAVYEIDGGALSVQLEDLQGRFNINSLQGAEPGQPVPATPVQRYFVRLLLGLESIELEHADAIRITEAVLDWIDSNEAETGFGGAEDSYYGELDQPYRAANAPFSAPSELRLVAGIDEDIYVELARYITVWPPAGAAININTAPAAVLAALVNEPGGETAALELVEPLLAARAAEGFPSMDEFLQHPVWGGKEVDGPELVATSEMFRLQASVRFYDYTHTMTSILSRNPDSGAVTVVARSMGGF